MLGSAVASLMPHPKAPQARRMGTGYQHAGDEVALLACGVKRGQGGEVGMDKRAAGSGKEGGDERINRIKQMDLLATGKGVRLICPLNLRWVMVGL